MVVATGKAKLSPLQHLLLEGLDQLPANWALTPVYGDKRPYRNNWQKEEPLNKGVLMRDIRSGKAKGYGIRTGVISGGIVAVDADGHAAHDKILELSGGVPLPETVAFTSNKPGRCQYLFYVPEEYWEAITTKKIGTGVKGEDGKEQKLELRWDGCQSVLPPSVHPETSCYQWRKSLQEIEIAQCPLWIAEQMLADTHQTAEPTYHTESSFNQKWSDEDWALSYLSALSPSRADDYDNWLAVGMALHSISDSLLTEWDNWSRQSSKYKSGNCEKKWKSFKRQGVAIGTLAHMAKQDGWRSPFNKSTGRSFSGGIGSGGGSRRPGGSGGSGGDGGDGDGGSSTGKVVRFPSFEALSIEQVTEKIDELVKSGATGSYLTGQLNRLAAVTQFYIGELRKLYYERLSEADLESDRDTNREEVDNLLKLTDQTLNLVDYLPEALATPLTNWCSWLSMRPAVALTALLAGMSSLHKVGTELVIHRNKHFEVPPTLYAALVAESGQLKSPIFSNIIRQPLNKLRQEKMEAYKAAMEDYETAMQVWEQSENKGEKPKKPADATLYFFTNATGEAIPVQASKVPDKALLALIDELAGLFKSENAHRNGRGSDKQDLLSYFDGTGQTVLRASGVKVDVEKIYLTIFGTIQPDILKGHMSDCSDPDGQWARFLFVNQPLSFAPLGDDDGQAVSIRERIADYYRQVERIPEMKYRLSRAAFKRYQPMHDHLERLRVTHPKPGMRAVYSKMKGIIGRLALNLHVLWELDAGKACPDEEIPLFIMEMAIALAKFYIGQIKLVHADSDNESLPTHIVKLVELSKRLEANGKDGWIKAQQYRESFASKKRPSSQQARNWMLEAKAQGFGDTRGEGNRLEYHWRSDNNDNPPSPPDNLGNLGKVREDLGKGIPYAETIENKEVETNLGNLGKGIPNSSTTSFSGYIPHETEEEIYEEGGYVPAPSLSTTEISSDQETVGVTDLGNNLGNPIPNPSLSSLDDNSHEVAALANPTQEDEASGSAKKLEEQPMPVEQVASTSTDKVHSSSPAAAAEPDAPTLASEEMAQPVEFTFEEEVAVLAPILADEGICPNKEELAIEAEVEPEQIVVGSVVLWDNCPSHWDYWSPFVVEIIYADGMVKLEMAQPDCLVHVSELRLANQT